MMNTCLRSRGYKAECGDGLSACSRLSGGSCGPANRPAESRLQAESLPHTDSDAWGWIVNQSGASARSWDNR